MGKQQSQKDTIDERIEDIRKKRYIAVDDNATNRKILYKQLTSWGCRIETAASGIQALAQMKRAKAEGKPFDVAIIDYQMPEMDGLSATRKIRKLRYEASNVPIIALTAHAMKKDYEQCIEAGMNDYLSKPVDPDKLLKKIEKWVMPESMSQKDALTPLPR